MKPFNGYLSRHPTDRTVYYTVMSGGKRVVVISEDLATRLEDVLATDGYLALLEELRARE
jgi:hypothetical protein